ncbi:MAG: glutamyl-tRNA reductase [Halobacteriales archaeon]|nr:glutamyl-tRNA reductase [Halobacteriales archaeon]
MTTDATDIISGLRLTHHETDVDTLDAAKAVDQRSAVERLLAADPVSEAFVLYTCNRVEAYVVTDDDADGHAVLREFLPERFHEVAVTIGHEESLRHLMRVAAGLESLIIGEDQIIGQVRTAYQDAREVGAIGEVLEEAITKAIHVGERARTETAINEGVVSIGSAAVELAQRELDLDGRTALVIGAGKMGTIAANAFGGTPIDRLYIANRTIATADALAAEVDVPAEAVGHDALETVLGTADVVISATGSDEYVLDATTLRDAGETLVIDIAQPRDVSPAASSIETVSTYDLDSLETVTDTTTEQRRAAAETVERMIDAEFNRLLNEYKRGRADKVIAAMYESAETVKEEEIQRAFDRLEANGDLTEDQREIIAAMADSLVSQLLAAPTKSLREAAAEDDWSTINTALQLFDPEFDGEEIPEPVRAMLNQQGADMPAGVFDDH